MQAKHVSFCPYLSACQHIDSVVEASPYAYKAKIPSHFPSEAAEIRGETTYLM